MLPSPHSREAVGAKGRGSGRGSSITRVACGLMVASEDGDQKRRKAMIERGIRQHLTALAVTAFYTLRLSTTQVHDSHSTYFESHHHQLSPSGRCLAHVGQSRTLPIAKYGGVNAVYSWDCTLHGRGTGPDTKMAEIDEIVNGMMRQVS